MITDIADDVKNRKRKATDLVDESLKAIAAYKDYDAIISTLDDRAKSRAEEIDKNPRGKLAGIPFIAKDNFLTLGGKTTAASNILRPFEAPYQATAINKLEAEGAICVAKANLDAFAHGSSTENSDWFVTKNPHDKSRVPGGSSGGSAASVVLGMVPFALGTDTGGSVRLPASFTGSVGYKPTYGLISRSGVIAMASSTDVVGPIAKSVEDVALILDVMSGRDDLDATTIDRDIESYTDLESQVSGKKIGVIKEYFNEGLDDGVKKVIKESIEKLKVEGADVKEISLPSLPLALAVYYIVCPAEVSSNLSRYDGQRYGYSAPEAKTLDESYDLSRERGFGAEAKRRIMTGTYVLSSGYYDAYYKKAQTVRTKIINEFESAFESFDFLVGPVAPTPAFRIGEKSGDPLQMYLSDIMTVAANMSGNPAISVPAGSANNLPVGFQIIGPMRGDRKLLGLAKTFEGLK
jgi:aspartyl-tRNA(Asn)/glutamyl-tRNA(Gln) amidotransferase subunit A